MWTAAFLVHHKNTEMNTQISFQVYDILSVIKTMTLSEIISSCCLHEVLSFVLSGGKFAPPPPKKKTHAFLRMVRFSFHQTILSIIAIIFADKTVVVW